MNLSYHSTQRLPASERNCLIKGQVQLQGGIVKFQHVAQGDDGLEN